MSPSSDRYPMAMLVRRLESIAQLSDEERQAILGLPAKTRVLDARQDIVRDGDKPSHCCLLLDGWACRYKMLSEGRRQILSFHIPGDIPDLQSLHLHTMDHSLATLTKPPWPSSRTRACAISTSAFSRRRGGPLARHADRCGDLPRVDDRHRPPLGLRADRAPLLRDVPEARGGGACQRASLPVADHAGRSRRRLGLSNVHVNRALQEMRGKGLITLRSSTLDDPGLG